MLFRATKTWIRGLIRTLRTILYPELEDHGLVHHYPPVQGMEKDVFFMSHANPEDAEADSVSRYNMFEVRPNLSFALAP